MLDLIIFILLCVHFLCTNKTMKFMLKCTRLAHMMIILEESPRETLTDSVIQPTLTSSLTCFATNKESNNAYSALMGCWRKGIL